MFGYVCMAMHACICMYECMYVHTLCVANWHFSIATGFFFSNNFKHGTSSLMLRRLITQTKHVLEF